MITHLEDPAIRQAIAGARAAALAGAVHPSPIDWRDSWIYFVLLDRFNNPSTQPAGHWNRVFGERQGGTFAGVTTQLDYLRDLGCGAIWLSPVLKNPRPAEWLYNYHGYATQDFLNIDERFASDGTRATAETELRALVDGAHARGLHVIVDIVLNHAGRVFDYVVDGQDRAAIADEGLMNAPLGAEPHVRWLNGFGFARADWEDGFPLGTVLSPDDAVHPDELRSHLFFRRRGSKLTDHVARDDHGRALPDAFVRGDFDTMRQLVVEYDATVPGQEALRAALGPNPVLSILIRAYSHLVARFELDGFRIDTVKYVHPRMIEIFGNAMREFALTVGKRNFFTFAEVYDDERAIAAFVGRNSADAGSFGVDAALDFPLFFKLPGVSKELEPVEALRTVFEQRKAVEQDLLSSHGEAGRYFVSFLDNHDQKSRFNHPAASPEQITLGYALLFGLQGIPAVYYGTEQGLDGTRDASGNPDLASNESCREALWGKPNAFDRTAPLYQSIRALSECRRRHAALRYGRLYFREVSGNGRDFGHSSGSGGVVAFSRILADEEVVVVANTNTVRPFAGFVLVDPDLHRHLRRMQVVYSNRATSGGDDVKSIAYARLHRDGESEVQGSITALYVKLAPMEVQILG